MARKKSASKLFDQENPTPMEDSSMNLPEAETEETKEEVEGPSDEREEVEEKSVEEEKPPVDLTPNEEGIIDIEFNEIKKQRFRFNGDNSKILELNTNDLSVSYRLKESYTKLNGLMEKVADTLDTIPDDGEITEEKYSLVTDKLKELDDEMKKEVDYLFNAPVSKVLCSDGSMYDPRGGVFRYEHIIEKLSGFYETDLNREFFNLKQRVADRTSKYTKVQRMDKYHR